MLKNSLVIRQKCESQNECFKKTKHVNFPKNEHFLPSNTHTAVLKHPFWDSPFCLLPTSCGYSYIIKEDLVVKELSCTIHIFDTNIASVNFN